MEAETMSIPAIPSNKIGCREIMEEGYDGRLIYSKTAKKLINSMEEFVLNFQLLKQIPSVSKQYVTYKYEQKQLWDKALIAYKKIVNDV